VTGKLQKEVDIDQLPLQLAVIDFIGEEDDGVFRKKEEKEVNNGNEEVTRATEEVIKSVEKKIENNVDYKVEKSIDSKVEKNKEAGQEVKVKEVLKEEKTNNCGCDLTRIEESWGKLLSCIKPHNHSVEAFLRATRPKMFNGKKLVVEVFYPFHKDKLEELKNKQIVETEIKNVFGISAVFECVLSKDKKKPLVVNNDTPIEDVTSKLEESKNKEDDLYSVVKDIFS
jgi:DNA polymerase-3 subunit gamma/tau